MDNKIFVLILVLMEDTLREKDTLYIVSALVS